MVRIHERLAAFKDAFMVNMIHDELVVECLEQAEREICPARQAEGGS